MMTIAEWPRRLEISRASRLWPRPSMPVKRSRKRYLIACWPCGKEAVGEEISPMGGCIEFIAGDDADTVAVEGADKRCVTETIASEVARAASWLVETATPSP